MLTVPDEVSWDYLRRNALAGDIKLKLDNAMRILEERHPDRLQGVLPRIYANSNLEVDQVAGQINLFSKDIFSKKNAADLLGRTYEYSSRTSRAPRARGAGSFSRPARAPAGGHVGADTGKMFDPACRSGGMFVQRRFTKHDGACVLRPGAHRHHLAAGQDELDPPRSER